MKLLSLDFEQNTRSASRGVSLKDYSISDIDNSVSLQTFNLMHFVLVTHRGEDKVKVLKTVPKSMTKPDHTAFGY